jgi:adenylate cyclase
MAFRIGVNLGDVIEKGDTIYGDDVNIAGRLESLAEGGGICISGIAFDQIGKKVPLGYKYLGEQTVKNIEKPIRAYTVLVEPEAVGKVIGENRRLKIWHWTAIFGLMLLIIVAGAEGMTAEQIVRAAIIKKTERFSYEELAFHLADSITNRAFCRIGIAHKTFKKSALCRNIKSISPETREAIDRLIVA